MRSWTNINIITDMIRKHDFEDTRSHNPTTYFIDICPVDSPKQKYTHVKLSQEQIVRRLKDGGLNLAVMKHVGMNPFRAPNPLPILNPSNFVPKTGFQWYRGWKGQPWDNAQRVRLSMRRNLDERCSESRFIYIRIPLCFTSTVCPPIETQNTFFFEKSTLSLVGGLLCVSVLRIVRWYLLTFRLFAACIRSCVLLVGNKANIAFWQENHWEHVLHTTTTRGTRYILCSMLFVLGFLRVVTSVACRNRTACQRPVHVRHVFALCESSKVATWRPQGVATRQWLQVTVRDPLSVCLGARGWWCAKGGGVVIRWNNSCPGLFG